MSKRIAVLIQGTNLGGMEQASVLLWQALQAQGHSCVVLSLTPFGMLAPRLADLQIEAHSLGIAGRGGWRSLPRIRHACTTINADGLIMVGHHLLAMSCLPRARRRHQLLIVHHYHGSRSRAYWAFAYRIALGRFDSVAFASDFLRFEAEALYPALKGRSSTLHNPFVLPPIPSVEQRRDARLALGLPCDVPVIGNAGWLIHSKRFDVFLNVLAAVKRQIPSVLAVIAGDGPLRSQLQVQAAALGVTGNLRFLGWRKDMAAFYSALDVVLFNSDVEGLGRTPLEALTWGVPVVASVLKGGLREVITSDAFGFLTDVHSESWLTERIIQSIDRPGEARARALAGRKLIAEYGSPAQIATQTCALLSLAP
jgi:glycosyltransferase involved in cell wall biosynthesis